ncbi:tetratricopeptide repeat protein [Asanoa iriomotensis]|uniref:AAA+ ATPase domain-containing protein n=1 Tax=Asanoa iriomotensis TaxID=234613 RepID=A0ABQ4CAS9_9ACTN|nr:tetratricopeptide repeat protein [Asanoa iriomotensis]GIF59884.1 hypothetical protein Air01nite_59790 [Asanoa iriomotensis]
MSPFVGRRDDLDRALRVIRRNLDSRAEGAAILVHGPPGIGKTSFAVEVAEQAAQVGDIPVVLYANLEEARATPQGMHDALTGFLLALGVRPDVVPESIGQGAALLRSLLHEQPAVVVLDDVPGDLDDNPLAPGGSPGSVLIMASRSRPRLVSSMRVIELSGLAPDAAAEMFTSVSLGSVDRDTLLRLAKSVLGNPLAIRLAGLHVRQDLGSLPDLLDAVARQRGPAAEAVLDRTLARLDDRTARAFGQLSVLGGPDFGLPVAEAVLDQPGQRVRSVLDRLATLGLLGQRGDGRYAYDHAVIHERAVAAGDDVDQRVARTRAIEFYANEVGARDGARPESDPWFEVESRNLLWAVATAAEAEMFRAVIRLAVGMSGHLRARGRLGDLRVVLEHALVAGRTIGDEAAVADTLSELGHLYADERDYGDALGVWTEALNLARSRGDRLDEANRLLLLGQLQSMRGEEEEAIGSVEEALSIGRTLDDKALTAEAFAVLGQIYARSGAYGDAIPLFEHALTLFRELGEAAGSPVMIELANVYTEVGRLDEASPLYEESLAILRSRGEPASEALVLARLGALYDLRNEHERAINYLERSRSIFTALGSRPDLAQVLQTIGSVEMNRGEVHRALAAYNSSLSIATDIDLPELVCRVSVDLAEVYAGRGAWSDAVDAYRRGIAAGVRIGNHHAVAYAKIGLGLVLIESGELDSAVVELSDSVATLREFQEYEALADAFHALGSALLLRGALGEAEAAFEQSAAVGRDLDDPAIQANALMGLAAVLGAQGQWYEVPRVFDAVTGLVGANADAYLAMGDVYASHDRATEARSYYRQALSRAADLGDADARAAARERISSLSGPGTSADQGGSIGR